MFALFISAMAFQQDNQDLQTQEAQFRDIFLNLSKGQEELRTLLMGNLVKKSPEDNKDERLKHLQAEVDAMKTQMLGQRALIQGLAQEQGELRAMISQLHQDMKQPAQVRDPVINKLPRSQRFGLMNGPLQADTTSQVQQRPRQEQRADQSKPDKPKRQFTKLNVSLSQAVQQLLRLNLVTLRDPPKNPNKTPSRYNPNAHCAYHSDSPGHATDDCWTLRNKVQDLIDAKEVEFEAPETPNVITAPLPKHG